MKAKTTTPSKRARKSGVGIKRVRGSGSASSKKGASKRSLGSGTTWEDDLFGSAVFSAQELAGDDRQRGLVERARTKVAGTSARRA
jgi:hypothetical protein